MTVFSKVHILHRRQQIPLCQYKNLYAGYYRMRCDIGVTEWDWKGEKTRLKKGPLSCGRDGSASRVKQTGAYSITSSLRTMHCQTSYGTTRWVLQQVDVWGFQRIFEIITSVVCKEHELQVCENTVCWGIFLAKKDEIC